MNPRVIITRIGLLVEWIGMAVVSAVLYGIINNQITVTISPEYFAVYKHHQFASMLGQFGVLNAPMRVQAIVIGLLSTWWFGLFLGIVLSICGMVGRYDPISTRSYIHAVARVMITTFCVSFLFCISACVIGLITKPNATQHTFLSGIQDTRKAFCVGWWHNGAYLGALISTYSAGIRIYRQRRTKS